LLHLEDLPRQDKIDSVKSVSILLVLFVFVSCGGPILSSREVSVETLPPEAEIYIDGKYAGLTPSIVFVSDSTVIKVAKDGYEDRLLIASELSKGQTLLRIEMNKLHEIVLDYQPEGAQIWENGKPIGNSPLNLKRPNSHIRVEVRYELHHDLIDEFDIKGATRRTLALKPSVKYFPDTVCMISSEPQVADILHIGLTKDGKLYSDEKILGKTPFEMRNDDLAKLSQQHLFILKKQGFLPSIINATGSFSAQMILQSGRSQNYEVPSKTFKDLDFQIGLIKNEESGLVLEARVEGDKLKIISKKIDLEVSIADLEVPYTKDSGAAWASKRFFVVRFSLPTGELRFVVYDAVQRRRIRLEHFGMFSEAQIIGDIEFRQRIPVHPTRIEEFRNIYITNDVNKITIYFSIEAGDRVWGVVKSDEKLKTSNLVAVAILK